MLCESFINNKRNRGNYNDLRKIRDQFYSTRLIEDFLIEEKDPQIRLCIIKILLNILEYDNALLNYIAFV